MSNHEIYCKFNVTFVGRQTEVDQKLYSCGIEQDRICQELAERDDVDYFQVHYHESFQYCTPQNQSEIISIGLSFFN